MKKTRKLKERYAKYILEGKHTGRVQTEVRAWPKVLEQLEDLVEKLDPERRDEARKLIHKTVAALAFCKGEKITPANRKLTMARRDLKRLLPIFDDWASVIDTAFFIHMTDISLDRLITRTAAICAEGVTPEQKRELWQRVESANNAFGAKLVQIEQGLKLDEKAPTRRKKK